MYTCIYYVYIDNIILYIHPCNFHPFLRPRPRHLRRFGEETHRGSARALQREAVRSPQQVAPQRGVRQLGFQARGLHLDVEDVEDYPLVN